MVIFILIAGISILILVHEFGHFLAAKRFGILVEEFGIGFPPRLFAKKIGETVWSVNALPFGGFVRIHGEKPEIPGDPRAGVDPSRSFTSRPLWKRAVIIAAGVIMNFFLGWMVISGVFAVGIPERIMIQEVAARSPAELAGLTAGDVIKGFSSIPEFIAAVEEAKGEEMPLTVLRDGETVTVAATPRSVVPEGEGALGISLVEVGKARLSVPQSLAQGFITSLQILWSILTSLAALIVGLFTGGAVAENFVGPIGIFEIANQSARFGFVHLFELIGLISLNLVVFNVLPIPALDGGRLFFLLVEKIKGSPVAVKREAAATAISFIVLILLMVLVTVRDVIRLF